MSENRYGNLLDKYMGKERNNSNKILNDFTRSKKEEGKGKYGTLLNNVGELRTIYDSMLDCEKATSEYRRNKAEEERQEQERIQKNREREKQELQARRDKNTAFINDYLAKKEATQKAIEEKKKKEAEQAEIYKHIEKLMQTSPKAAEAYAEIYANKLKKI